MRLQEKSFTHPIVHGGPAVNQGTTNAPSSSPSPLQRAYRFSFSSVAVLFAVAFAAVSEAGRIRGIGEVWLITLVLVSMRMTAQQKEFYRRTILPRNTWQEKGVATVARDFY